MCLDAKHPVVRFQAEVCGVTCRSQHGVSFIFHFCIYKHTDCTHPRTYLKCTLARPLKKRLLVPLSSFLWRSFPTDRETVATSPKPFYNPRKLYVVHSEFTASRVTSTRPSINCCVVSVSEGSWSQIINHLIKRNL